MIEAFMVARKLFFERLGSRVDNNFRGLEQWLPVDVEVLDTGAADVPLSVAHGLGRVPRGMQLLNQETGAGDGPVSWYRTAGDDAWTSRAVVVRFDVANARVLLRIW